MLMCAGAIRRQCGRIIAWHVGPVGRLTKRVGCQRDAHQTMRTTPEGARASTPPTELASEGRNSAALVDRIVHWLDEAKAEEVSVIDLKGKSSIGDFMVIATGRSDRHVNAVA